jgi:hypothetical protein
MMPNDKKRSLLKTVDDDIVKGFEQQAKEIGNDDIFGSFHVLDLNGDKQQDIVYNGFGGAADEFVMVFLKLRGVYTKQLHTYGHVEVRPKAKSGAELVVYKPRFVGSNGSDSTSFYVVKENKIVNTLNRAGKPN